MKQRRETRSKTEGRSQDEEDEDEEGRDEEDQTEARWGSQIGGWLAARLKEEGVR